MPSTTWPPSRVGVRNGLDHQREHPAVERTGNPGLGAVDDAIAVAPGDGTDRLEVGSGVGFRQRRSGANSADREFFEDTTENLVEAAGRNLSDPLRVFRVSLF